MIKNVCYYIRNLIIESEFPNNLILEIINSYKTLSNEYFHDNMAFHGDFTWSYEFDWMTINKDALSTVAVASSDEYGNVATARRDKT